MEHVTVFISASIRRHSFAAPRPKMRRGRPKMRRGTQQIKRVSDQENKSIVVVGVRLLIMYEPGRPYPVLAEAKRGFHDSSKANGWSKNSTKRSIEFSAKNGARKSKGETRRERSSVPRTRPLSLLFRSAVSSLCALTNRTPRRGYIKTKVSITQWLLNNTWKSSKMTFIRLLFLTAII